MQKYGHLFINEYRQILKLFEFLEGINKPKKIDLDQSIFKGTKSKKAGSRLECIPERQAKQEMSANDGNFGFGNLNKEKENVNEQDANLNSSFNCSE